MKAIGTNLLHVLRGFWDDPRALSVTGKAASDIEVPENFVEGRCVHFNDDGDYEMGAGGNEVPLFLIMSGGPRHELEAEGDDHNFASVGPRAWTAIIGMPGFVLSTTEFDDTATYLPNQLLTSPRESDVGAGNETEAGKIYNGNNWTGGDAAAIAVHTHPVIGVTTIEHHLTVATAAIQPRTCLFTDKRGKKSLAFLTYWHPTAP